MSSHDHKKKTEDTSVKATFAPVGGVMDGVVDEAVHVVDDAVHVVDDAVHDVDEVVHDVDEVVHVVDGVVHVVDGVVHGVDKATSQPATHTSISGAGKMGDSSYKVIGPGGNSGTVNIGGAK